MTRMTKASSWWAYCSPLIFPIPRVGLNFLTNQFLSKVVNGHEVINTEIASKRWQSQLFLNFGFPWTSLDWIFKWRNHSWFIQRILPFQLFYLNFKISQHIHVVNKGLYRTGVWTENRRWKIPDLVVGVHIVKVITRLELGPGTVDVGIIQGFDLIL